MDIPRKTGRWRRWVRLAIILVVLGGAAAGVTVWLSRLQVAAPTQERSAVLIDTVKRGSMTREVRGLGTLVPEETLLIPATTEGRVDRILIRPGNPVRPGSVVMELTNPELQTALLDAEFTLKVAEASYTDLRVQLEKQGLDLQAAAAQVRGEYHTATLQAERDAALAKEGLFSAVDASISAVKAKELGTREQLEQKRLAINHESVDAQLAAQKVRIEQLRAQVTLKRSQVEQLKVRAGAEGMLQQLPTPVEVGQKVAAGTPLGKVAQPSKLKAELKIAETQIKDIVIGQRAVVDTRNGLIEGRVARIDPSALGGTFTVDVRLVGALPQAARPDLSVDGTIELENLAKVLHVGRPVFGQPDSTVQLFRLEADGKHAGRVKVQLGRASVNTIEIREGLKVGDQVILSDMSAFDNVDRIRLN
jgi:HlyD family secretion protein